MCCISFQRDETQHLVRNNIFENIWFTVQFINQPSISDILKRFSFCLQFHDSENEAGICLSPLHFEAHKTVGLPSEMISITMTDLVSIHPIIYAYFLQYKNSGMLNKKGDMCVALKKLEHMNKISLQKGIYSHPDTTLNLLGHIYMTRGWYRLAVQCFRSSLTIEPYYRTVKLHVMFMLF